MDNSLLVSLSQQLAAYRSMDVIANNLANVSTPGFKREAAKFEEYHHPGARRPKARPACSRSASSRMPASVRDHQRRAVSRHTGAPFDFAINGKGYFVVQTPQGDALHPRRPFHARRRRPDRHQRRLCRCRAMAAPSPSRPTTAIFISRQDGTSPAVNDIGQIGKLRSSISPTTRALTKEGANLYSTTQTPTTADRRHASRQGMLEASNVQPVIEISHMIEVMRAYQATATLDPEPGRSDAPGDRQAWQMPN